MLSPTSCWPCWSSCSGGVRWHAAQTAPSRPLLPTSTCCYSSLCCYCRPTMPGISAHHAVYCPVWFRANVGRFDRRALAVRTTRLGFLHSKNGDQINSVRRPFPGLGLYDLEDPDAADRRRRVIAMSLSGEVPGTHAPLDPRRYHESVTGERTEVAQRPPVCLYLEVTNRCNLLCTTCPRTYEELEPPADMSWDLFTSIVDQAPGLARAVLHAVGESMLVA